MQVKVYTDGGCKPNPGPGGWGAVIRFDDHEWLLSGNSPDTTNNQMELQAAITALATLQATHGRCTVDLFTDSEYLRQGITQWLNGWQQNGWLTQGKEPVKNQDLWQKLANLIQEHTISWNWLKGHAGHRYNERADQLATQAREELARPKTPISFKPAARAAEVQMYVKASYNPTTQIGGWGVVLNKGEHTKILSGRANNSSANALLIQGAIAGFEALTRPCSIAVYSDADYLVRGATQWITGWQNRGWKTKDGKPVANQKAWKQLLTFAQKHQVNWQLCKASDSSDLAHAGQLASQSVNK
jgi:ribonuclease HI